MTLIKIQEIIENYENSLARAWADFSNIDYDIVAESRIKTWSELEKLIK